LPTNVWGKSPIALPDRPRTHRHRGLDVRHHRSRPGRLGSMVRPRIEVSATVLGAANARDLARFYERLLGWKIKADEEHWVMMRSPDGGTGLSFQSEPDHVPPVWPAKPGDQQMMAHLDIGVDDLEVAIAWALECGAVEAAYQPQIDVRVMLDPAGHPFCLFPRSFDEDLPT